MNPFVFNPRNVTEVTQANYILSLYDQEVIAKVGQARALEDNLNAVADVLRQAHPDLVNDLELLMETAKYVGHSEGTLQDLDTLKSQFRSALPYGIKKQL